MEAHLSDWLYASAKYTMIRNDVMDIINRAEDAFPVDEWKISGVHAWPLLRFIIFFENVDEYQQIQKILKSGVTENLSRVIKGFIKSTYAYFANYNKNCSLRPTDVLLLSDGISFVWLKDAWFDKFIDPLIDTFREKHISSILLTPDHKYFIPRKSSSMFIQPYLDMRRLKSSISLKRTSYEDKKLLRYDEFLSFLESYNISVTSLIISKIRKRVDHLLSISIYFEDILKKTRPTLAFVVSYYNNLAFSLACRKAGVPLVDLQHGLQGDLHVSYGRWNKVPESGYELMPSIFWCWSEYEVNAINKWNKHVLKWHKAFVGGNMLIRMWLEGTDEVVKYYDHLISVIKKKNPASIHFLYTLQGNEDMETLKAISQVLNKNKTEYRIWIRLHPCYTSDKDRIINILKELDVDNYDIDNASNLPLYALLRNVNIHITTYSSTVLEAYLFNVPSIITHSLGVDLFKEQTLSGWAVYAYNYDEIAAAIRSQLNRIDSLKKNKTHYQRSESQAFDYLLNLVH